jgi:hypothetical protein
MITKEVKCELCDETVKVRDSNGQHDLPDGWLVGVINVPETRESMLKKGYDLKSLQIHFCPKCTPRMNLK